MPDLTLPELAEIVSVDEFVLDDDQQARLSRSETDRRSRWYLADAGTAGPQPDVYDDVFVRPWPGAWDQLNDPAADAMFGICILDEADPGRGVIALVEPTDMAVDLWHHAMHCPVRQCLDRVYSIGVETATHCTPPATDYRAIFPACRPMPRLSDRTIRWSYTPAAGRRGFEVVSANYVPPAARRPQPPTVGGAIGGR